MDTFENYNILGGSKASLLSMWCSRMDAIAASRHEEFEGRSLVSGSQAELYTDLNTTGTNRCVQKVKLSSTVASLVICGGAEIPPPPPQPDYQTKTCIC